MNTTVVGIDLAKHSFSLCQMSLLGQVLRRTDLKRPALIPFLAQLPQGTIVAMEACSGANHWSRHCLALGLAPRIMAAQFVKPFRKSRAAKNDRNDAEAIATAARQGNMRFVPVKTEDQQARLAWHRVREGHKQAKTALSNRLRGLLAEFGIVLRQGDKALRETLASLDAYPDLPLEFVRLLRDEQRFWERECQAVDDGKARIEQHAAHDERCRRLMGMSGVGAITADAMVTHLGNGQAFKNGRQVSAWIGLVPRQFTTGGHVRLGRTSRDGDRYLRSLLTQGACSTYRLALNADPAQATPEQQWIQALARRTLPGKVVVAIANKHARQIWALLAHEVDYDPCAQVPPLRRKVLAS